MKDRFSRERTDRPAYAGFSLLRERAIENLYGKDVPEDPRKNGALNQPKARVVLPVPDGGTSAKTSDSENVR